MKSLFGNCEGLWFVALAAVLIGAGVGCTTLESGNPPKSAATNLPPQQVRDDRQIGTDLVRVGDVVQIIFAGVANPPPNHEERIKEDGLINLPLLNVPLRAAGRTRRELEDAIRDLYVPKIYLRLTVTLKTEQRFFLRSRGGCAT